MWYQEQIFTVSNVDAKKNAGVAGEFINHMILALLDPFNIFYKFQRANYLH